MADVTTEAPTGGEAPPNLGATLLRVAWLAVLLGFFMEGLLLAVGAGFGQALGTIAADLVRNVSWSVFVCVGLAVGTTLAKARLPLAGLTGLLAAPLAFEVSRALHKGTLEALAVSGEVPTGPALLVASLKGLEYGCLGMAVGWLGRLPWGGAAAHAGAGLVVGLVFGGAILILSPAGSQPAAELLVQAINEVLFPVGCALVLFSAGALGERLSRPDRRP